MCQRLKQLAQSYRCALHGPLRHPIQIPADNVAERVASEGVAGEQYDVKGQDQCADTDAEGDVPGAVGEPQRHSQTSWPRITRKTNATYRKYRWTFCMISGKLCSPW